MSGMSSSRKAIDEVQKDPICCIEARPEWVLQRKSASPAQADTGTPRTCLLVDYQTRVQDQGIQFYTRICTQILDASCLEDLSQWLYELEPSSQHLEIHSCSIQRGDSVIDALDEDNIRVLQREQGLENQVSSGRLTVELTIDDLRVGDILDIDVTEFEHSGSHPVRGRFLRASHWLSWSIPVFSQHVRVVNDRDIPIAIREVDSEADLDELQMLQAKSTYDRNWSNLLVKSVQPMLPDQFWPHCLMLTTHSQWHEVADHLSSFYTDNGSTDDTLDLEDIAADISDTDLGILNEASLLALVRYVQNTIRYRSETSGIYSHTPRPPSRTMKKRAGDCKDKSNLLVYLLRKLGVEADLALVNTRLRGAVATLDPSPLLFDHMVVSFVWQKQRYWVDATHQKQAGDLDNLSQLAYRQALLLSSEGAGLIELPFSRDQLAFRLTHNFDLSDIEQKGARIEVLREYRGARADNMRYYLASAEATVLQERFHSYSCDEVNVKLSPIEPLAICQDDQIANVLITCETYRVETRLGELEGGLFQVGTDFFDQIYDPPSEHHPMQISADGVLEHKIKVLYANEPTAEAEEFRKSNQWFEYSDEICIDENELQLNMRYAPLDPLVKVSDQREYTADVTDIRNRSNNRFVAINESHQSYAQVFIWLIVLLLGLVILLYKDRMDMYAMLPLVATAVALSFHKELNKLIHKLGV